MPRDDRLFTLFLTVAVCLYTVKLHVCMLWLTVIMRTPAIARRTIAVELLRQFDQMESYRHRSHSTPAPQLCSADSTHHCLRFKLTRCRSRSHLPSVPTMKEQFQQSAQRACRVAATCPTAAPNDPDNSHQLTEPASHDVSGHITIQKPVLTGSVHSFVPRDGLTNASSEDAQDFNNHKLQTEHSEGGAPTAVGAQFTPPVSPWKKSAPSEARLGDTHDSTSQPGGNQRPINREPQINPDCTPPLSDFGSANSDATSVERDRFLSPRFDRLAVSLQDDAVEGANEHDFNSPDRTFASTTNEVLNGSNEPHTHKHWRDFSSDSVSTTIRKLSSMTLRAQRKTSGGLLELRASTTKSTEPVSTRAHRRNMSLNLPIHPRPQPRSIWHNRSQSSCSSVPIPSFGDGGMSIAAQMESELQYKHRHIFVGTASLHCFLDVLETPLLGSTTKPAIMRAFTILASKEQLMARQRSLTPEDWNLVTRITADISEFDYITLARVQLGSISLQQFLGSIPFNIHDEVPIMIVVDAFKNASHTDAEKDRSAGSKARAFRKWLLSQGNLAG